MCSFIPTFSCLCTKESSLQMEKKRDKQHSHFPITIPFSPCDCFSSEGICSPKINMRILNIFLPVSHMRPDHLLKLKLVWEIFKAKLHGLPGVQKTSWKKGISFPEFRHCLTGTTCLSSYIHRKCTGFSPRLSLSLLAFKFIWFYWSDGASGSRAAEGALSEWFEWQPQNIKYWWSE